MPDNDPHQNAPHLQERLGVAASGYLPPVTQHERVAADQLAGLAAADQGAARRFLHELEHGLGPWVVDPPWRLIEALAARLRGPRGGGETEAPDAVAGTGARRDSSPAR